MGGKPHGYLIIILKIFVIILRQRHGSGIGKFLLIFMFGLLIKVKFRRLQGRRLHEVKLIVPRQLPRQPEKWLLKVVVRFGRNVIVLQVLLPMEGDLLCLDLTVLDFYLVPREDDGDILADTGEIAMPVGDVFVRDSGRDVEHDDGALALDVIPVAQSPELLLAGGIPDVEFDGTPVGVEDEGVDFDSEGGDVLLLEFSRQVPLDEGGFTHSSVADEDELKFWYFLLSRHFYLLLGGGGLVEFLFR